MEHRDNCMCNTCIAKRLEAKIKADEKLAEGDKDNPCPKCGASDLGPPIPERLRTVYAGTRWRKHVGMYDMSKDCTTEWMCCECGHRWDRDFVKGENINEVEAHR